MANWKKMAEAFGRAMSERVKDTPASKVVEASKTVKDLDKLHGHLYDASREQLDYLKGAADGDRIANASADDVIDYVNFKPIDVDRVAQYRDKLEDAYTDKRLRDTRHDEWDGAFKSAKERVKRDYGDDYPKDMAAEGADTFESQLWDVIDELKAQGRSVDDILGALKSMGQK